MDQGLEGAGSLPIWVTVLGLGVSLTVMVLRNRRPRKLRIGLLWIRPLSFAAIVALSVWAYRPPVTIVSLTLYVLAVTVGGALGWQRGRFMKIDVEPETHAVTSRASPIGMVVIIAFLGLRIAFRGVALESYSPLGVPAAAVTEGLVLLAGSMIVVQSLEMWLRARRLLAQAQAATRLSALA
jgi:hypothetical protein